jgi:nicotinate-nucleotide adenylyltransferase
MPAGQPWQKAGTVMPCAADRLAMCAAAIEAIAPADGKPSLQHCIGVEPCETQRRGNTYTVDTLRHLCALHPDTRYTLIMGADQAARLDTWHDWRGILGLCRLAVVARNGVAAVFAPAVSAAMAAQQLSFDTLHFPAHSTASSHIRALMNAGHSITDHVPAAVERYIVKHSLYKL